MRTLFVILACLLPASAGFSQKTSVWAPWNDGWDFVRDGDSLASPGLFERTGTNNIKWQNVTLPHTANLEPMVIKGDQWQGICWYRKFFRVPAVDAAKRLSVYFEAAMHTAHAYLNGNLIVTHNGGYLPFEVDLTGKVKSEGENCLLVILDNRDNPQIPPGKPIRGLDFNFFSGLYRNVYLIKQDRLHFPDAVAINRRSGGAVMIQYKNVSREKASITIKAEVQNDHDSSQNAQVRMTLCDAQSHPIVQNLSPETEVAPGGCLTFRNIFDVLNPNLWTPENPYLYILKIELITAGEVIEELNIRPGIRSIRFTTGGFYLNGSKYRIRGTNRHQEYPYVGYALPDNAQFRDAWKIKEAGFNFVRCSHYPQSTAFLDACDELGIMVMDAIPGWQFYGDQIFQSNSYQDIKDMVRRDRNHPSIILWEASLNESGMTNTYMETANSLVHQELPYAEVFTSGWIEGIYDVFIPARQHSKPPDYWSTFAGSQPLLISEYGDWEYYAQNAGFNQTSFSNLKEAERSSRQLRGDGEIRLLQQALNYQESHNDNYRGPAVGDANWLMFDYNRGYAPDIESSGISDIFRLPKFAYYFYQSQYGPAADLKGFGKPMVFIASYFEKESPDFIKVFSNCEEVELHLNGRLVARQKPDSDQYSTHLPHPPFTFRIPGFEPGTLEAIGYITGVKVAERKQTTPGKSVGIQVRADLSGKNLEPGIPDLIFIYASMIDAKGTVVGKDTLPVRFSVNGQAELIGDNPAKAEAGIAGILLKTSGQGNITVTATAAGLKTTSLVLKTKRKGGCLLTL
ncbi:MAG: glycoside hydrolase family 2 TIM barrel-domain containing protein [Bacteroidales bacterium]|jgi:beta-galactosidase